MPYIRIIVQLLSNYFSSGEEVVASLPAGVVGANVTWVGVWCRAYSVDFGHVWLIPDDQIPASASDKSVSIIVMLSILFVLLQ